MRPRDLLTFAGQSLLRARMRSAMMLVAMAIGVAAVVMLTALGEGARRYVTAEFSGLGTNLIVVLPGRTETGGVNPALMSGDTPRDLTIGDMVAVSRLPTVIDAAPLTVGQATVSSGSRERDTTIMGTTAAYFRVRNWTVSQGEYLPEMDPDRTASVCVIGSVIASELFPGVSPLGQWLRIGDRRFRVIGVLGKQGRSIGFDAQELVVVPVASAQAMFNKATLFRILVAARSRDDMAVTRAAVLETLQRRHQGEEDVTVVTQDAVLATFDRIFTALTLALGLIAAVSLVVAGILIMNVMLVAVSQRTAEVGLLKALGARPRQITAVFLSEAVMLASIGAVIGLALGQAATWGLRQVFEFDAVAPGWAIVAAVVIACASGVVFGILPARRAARLDPVLALAGKA